MDTEFLTWCEKNLPDPWATMSLNAIMWEDYAAYTQLRKRFLHAFINQAKF